MRVAAAAQAWSCSCWRCETQRLTCPRCCSIPDCRCRFCVRTGSRQLAVAPERSCACPSLHSCAPSCRSVRTVAAAAAHVCCRYSGVLQEWRQRFEGKSGGSGSVEALRWASLCKLLCKDTCALDSAACPLLSSRASRKAGAAMQPLQEARVPTWRQL